MELSKSKREKLQRFSNKLWAEFVRESEEWSHEEYIRWLVVKLYNFRADLYRANPETFKEKTK